MEIPLRSRQGNVLAYAVVDDEDYDVLAQWPWCRYGGRDGKHYAGRRLPNGGGMILMHRQIMGLIAENPLQVDHRDRNRLNNHRWNLRVATRAQQQQNLPSAGGRSRFRGVSWDETNKMWRATVVFEGKQYSCGRHHKEIDAARAADTFRLSRMTFANPDPELAKLSVPSTARAAT